METSKRQLCSTEKTEIKLTEIFISHKMSSMRDAMSIKQIEYKNAELVLCEFMAVQIYDEENPPKYKDFNLQDFHDFVADKIDAFDLYINSRAKWKKWPYKKCQLKKSSLDWEQI